MPPAGAPPQYGGYAGGPGGPPGAPGQPPSGGGGKTGLIIGLAVLVLVLLGGGLAFALTRSSDTVATPPTVTSVTVPTTTTPGETTTTKKDKESTTTTEEETTTTKKKNPSTSRLTTTTATEPSTGGDVKLYCATSKKLAADLPSFKGDDIETIKAKFASYNAAHLEDYATLITAAPPEIAADVVTFVADFTQAETDPSIITGPDFSTATGNMDTFEKANC
jgi:hypothetical protein